MKGEACVTKTLCAGAVTAVLSALALAQTAPTPLLQRQLHGQTIVSNEMPAADLTFDKEFRYIGSQVVNLYGNADAEQHLFVKAPSAGPVQAFYWVQFEHLVPTNKGTYDYKPDRTTDLGGLPFIYDVKSFPDYAAMEAKDPRSDGAFSPNIISPSPSVPRASACSISPVPTAAPNS